MAILPGGSCWSFCCCAAVLGVIVLKPEATSMLSLFWVLVWVVAQPIINADSAMALIILNGIRISFMFLVSVSSRFVVRNEWRTFLGFAGSNNGTLVLRS